MKKSPRKIIFLTGTRADFGKLKPLMIRIQKDPAFRVQTFVTGMHMLKKYGETHKEVNKSGIKNIYKFSMEIPTFMEIILRIKIYYCITRKLTLQSSARIMLLIFVTHHV